MTKCPQCSKTHSNKLSKFCSRPCSDLYVLNHQDRGTFKGRIDAELREIKSQNVIDRSEAARRTAENKTKIREDQEKWYRETISKCDWREQSEKNKIKIVKHQQNYKCIKCKQERLMNPVYLDGNSKNKDRTNIACVCSYCKRDVKRDLYRMMKADNLAKRTAKKAEKSKLAVKQA